MSVIEHTLFNSRDLTYPNISPNYRQQVAIKNLALAFDITSLFGTIDII